MSPNLHVRRWSDKAKMALIGLLTALVVLLAITALALGLSAVNDQRARDHSNQALRQAVSARQLAQVVNAERAATIGRDCADQNARHDNSIKALGKLYQKPSTTKLSGVPIELIVALTKLRVVQTRALKAPTHLLIDALVPYQDCRQLIKVATTPPR